MPFSVYMLGLTSNKVYSINAATINDMAHPMGSYVLYVYWAV